MKLHHHHSWFMKNILWVISQVNHESLIIHLWFIINHDSLIIPEWWFIIEWWVMMMNVDKWIKNHDSLTIYDSWMMINEWWWWFINMSEYSFIIDERIMDDDDSCINNYWIIVIELSVEGHNKSKILWTDQFKNLDISTLKKFSSTS